MPYQLIGFQPPPSPRLSILYIKYNLGIAQGFLDTPYEVMKLFWFHLNSMEAGICNMHGCIQNEESYQLT